MAKTGDELIAGIIDGTRGFDQKLSRQAGRGCFRDNLNKSRCVGLSFPRASSHRSNGTLEFVQHYICASQIFAVCFEDISLIANKREICMG